MMLGSDRMLQLTNIIERRKLLEQIRIKIYWR